MRRCNRTLRALAHTLHVTYLPLECVCCRYGTPSAKATTTGIFPQKTRRLRSATGKCAKRGRCAAYACLSHARPRTCCLYVLTSPLHPLQKSGLGERAGGYIDYSKLLGSTLLWDNVNILDPLPQTPDEQGRVLLRTNNRSVRVLLLPDACC